MPDYDLNTTTLVKENEDGLYEVPKFDLNTARPVIEESLAVAPETQEQPVTPIRTNWEIINRDIAKKELPRLQEELEDVEAAGSFDRYESFSRTKQWEEQRDNIKKSIELYQRAIQRAEKEPGFLEEFQQGISDAINQPEKLVPFTGSIIATEELIQAMTAAKKEEAGETMTGTEKALLDRFRAQSTQGKQGIGYGVGSMIANMPTFISEFALLGPVRQAVQKPVYEFARQGLNKALSKVVAVSIGAAAQGMANLPEIGERTANYLIPNYEQLTHPDISKLVEDKEDIAFTSALGKAIGTTTIDYVTEYAGGLLTKPLKFLKTSVLGKWAISRGFKTPDELAKAFKAVGWNGVIGEVFEEELAELGQTPIEERPYKAPLFTPEGTERLFTETLGIAAFGGLAKAGYMAIDAPRKMAEKRVYQERLNALANAAVYEYYNKRQADGSIYVLRTTGSQAVSAIPEIGEVAGFTNPNGLFKIGRVTDIIGNRATIDMDGHDVVVPLTQLYSAQLDIKGLHHRSALAPIFYSKMAGTLAEKMPESATIDQVRGIIQSSGTPKEEIEWSGINEFLKGKDKVNKAELLGYLQKNQMTIEETIKEQGKLEAVEADIAIEAFDGGAQVHGITPDNEYESIETREDLDRYNQFVIGNPKTQRVETTKYSSPKYNVVTENYKEMLLRVPQEVDEYGMPLPIPKYTEPHWDESGTNVFAHARFADITDSHGRKGILFNEIQSKWNQDLRKYQEAMKQPVAGEGFKPVPSHPVVARWHEVILKRLLRYAAENGYDFVAWASGEQVADYYNLSKEVDKIQWRKQGKNDIEFAAVKNGNTAIEKQVPKEELEKYIGKDAANKILAEMDRQEKVFKTNIRGELSGLDLKVGGTWAQNLYDRQIPNWLNDYAKKFGAQVEAVSIPAEQRSIPSTEKMSPMQAQAWLDKTKEGATFIQQSLTITPGMKRALLGEGQPMFGKMPDKIQEAVNHIEELAKSYDVEYDIEYSEKERYEDLSNPEVRASLEAMGFKKEDIDEAAKRGEKAYIRGTHDLSDTAGGKRSKIVLYRGFAAGDVYHEFAHATLEQGKIPGVTGTSEAQARYLEKIFMENKPIKPLIDLYSNIHKQTREMTTEELEDFIDKEYERGASQEVLDVLETTYEERISEDNQDIIEEELNVGEDYTQGTHLEEALIDTYKRYLLSQKTGEYRGSTTKEIRDNFLGVLQEIATQKPLESVTNDQVFEAAKELYESKQKLLMRRKKAKSGGKHLSLIRSLVSKYDEGDSQIATVEDVVDGVEEILSELSKEGESGVAEDKIIKAIDKFRKEQEYDRKLSGRGDMDTARDKVMAAIHKYLTLLAPRAKESGTKFSAEIEGAEPAPDRQEQRKSEMEALNSPDITGKLMLGDKEFLKKYIDEGKSLEEIAKELGEDIEDTQKTEMWVYAKMQEIADQERAEMEETADEDYQDLKNELKKHLSEQLAPELKTEGEYAELKHLPWLWAKEGKKGVRADELVGELAEMGFPVETEDDVRALISSYFGKEIYSRAGDAVRRDDKARQAKAKQGLKTKKIKPTVPERQLSGVGNGSVISNKEDINYEERAKIFRGMPFALLGNKAEVLARLPGKFKAAIKQGIEKVFDLWGGGKGYRSGLFPELPAQNYSLNELSDERSNYYKNIQDPEKLQVMKQTLDSIMSDFTTIMKDAFGLPEAKSDKDFLDMLNSWLKLGLQKERYYFAREVIQEFGDRLLTEAKADKFTSPESSAKYFFLENTSVFGLSSQGWTQGIIRTTKGDAYIRDVLVKLAGLSEKLDEESRRDQGMPVTQADAWQEMDKITEDIKSGKMDPETVAVAVAVDPQYLNPTEEAGTYSVGAQDNTWPGHKQNLEKHLLPLIKTGAKIIYTNNADPQLIAWLRANKLPYNINKSIGAVAERRGRDEVISLIGFDFGPEWTVGQIQPAGAGAIEPGQQYVAERVTGQSAKFTEWLNKQEAKRQEDVKKQELIAKIEQLKQGKMLSSMTVSRIKKYLGVEKLKNTGIPEIERVVEYIEGLKAGDKLLSENQIKVMEQMFGEIEGIAIMPKRIALERFGQSTNLVEGLIVSHIALELIPTVDIKQGNAAVTKIVNKISEKLEHAEREIHRRDDQLEAMLRKAQNSRAKKLSLKERAKRKLIKQDKEIFWALSGQKVELTKEEVAVVAYLKNFFGMVKEKLALEKYRKNYVTHLEQPLMEKIMNVGVIGAIQQYFEEQSLKKELSTDIMLELDNIIGSEKFFRFALERKGGIIPSTNIQKIVHDYSSLFETKVALDQVLPEGQVVTKLLLEWPDALWQKKFLQNLKGRGLDSEFRNGRMGWLTRVADGIVDLGYIKLLSLNYWSAVKNIVAGEANAIIWQDFSVYLKGKQRFFTAPKKSYKLAIEHGILDGTYADYSQRGIGKLKKLQDMAMVGQKAGEVEIRTSMFAGELTDDEWESGEISPKRSRELRDNVAITQGIFSKTESPLWVQTTLGRVIMQMNRWRITDAMLLRRIVNGAREEWRQGDSKGQNSQRLMKALFFYTIGMYASYELGKAGLKKAAQIAQALAETVNGMISLISQGDLKKMITDNPTLSVVKEFLFTAQRLAVLIHVPGAKKPKKVDIQQGIEETYIAPLNTAEEIIEGLEQ